MIKRTHFILGLLIVITFLLTGQYMHHNYNHLKDMELMNRALFRAGHLYILLFGLINLSFGAYFTPVKNGLGRVVQVFGSILIIVASILVIYSFFVELPSETIERPLARLSLYLIFGGVVLHGFVTLFKKEKTENLS